MKSEKRAQKFHPSSETQGQSVGPGEKARRKFSSTGGKAPGYRLSPDHFQTVKRILAPDWAQEMRCIIVPNRRTASPEFFSWIHTRRLLGTLRSSDATATRTSLKKWIWVLAVFIAIIPTYLLCQMKENPSGTEFLGTISKFRKRNKISSLLLYVLHKTRSYAFSRPSHAKTDKEMYKKAWCTVVDNVLVAVRFVGSALNRSRLVWLMH